MTSGARRTIALASSLLSRFELDADYGRDRLCERLQHYGPDNHLSPDFDVDAEHKPENYDAFLFAVVRISRGEWRENDPLVALYLSSIARAEKVRVVLSQRPQALATNDGGADFDKWDGPCPKACAVCDCDRECGFLPTGPIDPPADDPADCRALIYGAASPALEPEP